MIPLVGLMVATYAIARLVQVPIEAASFRQRWLVLALVSAPSILIIGYLAVELLFSGSSVETPRLP